VTKKHLSIYNHLQEASNTRDINCSNVCPKCSEHTSHILNTDLLVKPCFPRTSDYKIGKEGFGLALGITVFNDPAHILIKRMSSIDNRVTKTADVSTKRVISTQAPIALVRSRILLQFM